MKFGRHGRQALCERTLKQELLPYPLQWRAGEAPESAGGDYQQSRARDPRPDPPPRGWLHLLLLAFEQQERLEGRRGVHPNVAAASKVTAAATTASKAP